MTGENEGKAHQELQSYWLSLGRFVGAFAELESFLHMALAVHTDIKIDIAKSIFGSLQIDAAKETLTRILDSQNKSEIKHSLKRHFDQLSIITRTRNDILHYGASHQGDDTFRISNIRKAYVPSKLSEYVITAADLDKMTHDLAIIKAGITSSFPSLPHEVQNF